MKDRNDHTEIIVVFGFVIIASLAALLYAANHLMTYFGF